MLFAHLLEFWWNCLYNTPTEDGGEPGQLDGRLTLTSVRGVVKEALD